MASSTVLKGALRKVTLALRLFLKGGSNKATQEVPHALLVSSVGMA